MPAPLVIDVLRDQLLQVIDWYQDTSPAYKWGVAIHRRDERGRLHFGAVTPSGESLLLSVPLLDELGRLPCWLDGAVPVRLETREASPPEPWLDPAARGRAPLVGAIAIYFDPAANAEEALAFQQMAGVLTPATMPSQLFILTRERPAAWPR